MQVPDSTVKATSVAPYKESRQLLTSVRRIVLIYKVWRTRRRVRKVLEVLSDRLLADAGIERHQIPCLADKAARASVLRDSQQ